MFLRQLVRGYEDTYIMIDALDESPRTGGREDALQVLDNMWAWGERSLHLLVMRRDGPNIRDVLNAGEGTPRARISQ